MALQKIKSKQNVELHQSKKNKKRNLFANYKKYYLPKYLKKDLISDFCFIAGLLLWAIGFSLASYYGYQSRNQTNKFLQSSDSPLVLGIIFSIFGPIVFVIGSCLQRVIINSKSFKIMMYWNYIIAIALFFVMLIFLGVGVHSTIKHKSLWELRLALLIFWFFLLILIVNACWIYRIKKSCLKVQDARK